MIGAIVGDIAGSRFEFVNHKSKDFELLVSDEDLRGRRIMHKADKALLQKYEQDERSCFFTDDTVMSLAIAAALQRWRRNGGDVGESAIRLMREFGQRYPDESYGVSFTGWLHSENPQPYNSWGNGAAMRVSACAWVGQKLDEVKTLSVLSRR